MKNTKKKQRVSKKQVHNSQSGNPKKNKGFVAKKPKGPTTPQKRAIKKSLPLVQKLIRGLGRIRSQDDIDLREAFRNKFRIRPTIRGITFRDATMSVRTF